MLTVKNILIPTDFSETASLAVAHGAHMAHLFSAKIYLLHSVETTIYTGQPGEPVLIQAAETIYKLGVDQLNTVAEEIKKNYNIDIEALTVYGKPATAIAEAVNEKNIDIVIMGTHGASGFQEVFVGSNTNRAVHLSKCPVISIRVTSKNIGFLNIVMPISNKLNSRQKANNVIELATKYNSVVHVLGLLEAHDTMDENRFKIKIDSVTDALTKAHIKYTTKIVRGHNPAIEALKFSDEVNGDLIAIMNDHESDLTGMLLGTFSGHIVNHSKIPVMSIKPEETMIDTFDPSGGTGTL
jgi:nucleotide-binding universal stress UspA family protein